ncbi:MAG: hypothetical protein HZB51_31335 [Chloroflexi bacterium]|nr:hypothetical protein [Chloroflexota bacterium]
MTIRLIDKKMLTSIRQFLNGCHDTTMVLTSMLWVCILPVVLILTIPVFGWQGGLTAAAISFFIMLALCWGVCLFPKISTEEK